MSKDAQMADFCTVVDNGDLADTVKFKSHRDRETQIYGNMGCSKI